MPGLQVSAPSKTRRDSLRHRSQRPPPNRSMRPAFLDVMVRQGRLLAHLDKVRCAEEVRSAEVSGRKRAYAEPALLTQSRHRASEGIADADTRSVQNLID
jgi:hypothetical protein